MIEVENLRSTADEMLSGLHAPPGMAQRLRLQAGALDNLPQIAGEMLGSLQAGPALRHRILVAADRARHPFRLLAPACPRKRAAHPGLLRLTPALGMAVLLVIMLGVGSLYGGTVPGSPSNELESYAAGPVQTLSDVSQFRSLFAGEGANPPLLAINGRYYRMLTTPLAVSSSLVGAPIADVQTYTDEPSLSTRVGVVSNVVAERSQVYEVTGLCAGKRFRVQNAGKPATYAPVFARTGPRQDGAVSRQGSPPAMSRARQSNSRANAGTTSLITIREVLMHISTFSRSPQFCPV